jgi:hypothetical protein
MKKRFTIKSGVCPKCSSQNIEYSHNELNDKLMTFYAKCDDCNIDFIEEHTLNFNGVMIIDTNEYYDCGCEVEIERETK